MALQRKDAIGDTTATTGTGTLTLAGVPVTGFVAFNDAQGISDGSTVRYRIQTTDNTEWEVGTGVFTLATMALTRATVYASSNAGAKVAFGAGTKVVIVVQTVADFDEKADVSSLGALATVTPGTGVATALGVAVGSVGSVVTNGGALGTPSSGTLTNATGLPAAGVVGTAATLGAANIFTAAQEVNLAVADTSTDGAALETTTAATVGAQKWSPRFRWTGSGWKTNATAAAQAVDFIAEVQPVQGAAAPTANWVLSYQVNGGGYATALTVLSTGVVQSPKSGAHAVGILVSGQNFVGIGRNATTHGMNIYGGDQVTPSDTNAAMLFAAALMRMQSTQVVGWSPSNVTQNFDAAMGRAAPNSIVYSALGVAGNATSRTEMNKATTGIADAAATAVLTITIPNAAHSASLEVRVTGSLGAGGAIGANEATATNTYVISLNRTAGVNAVAAISAAYGGAASAVAGAATVTCTAAMSAVSGAVGASNSFTVNVTITKSGGASANHTCLVYAKLMNANSTGITLS